MNTAKGFVIGHDHPCLPGHFPGEPTVPGVVVLDHVIAEAEADRPDQVVVGIARVKFLRPIAPGERVTITLGADTGGSQRRFQCLVGTDRAAVGVLALSPATGGP